VLAVLVKGKCHGYNTSGVIIYTSAMLDYKGYSIVNSSIDGTVSGFLVPWRLSSPCPRITKTSVLTRNHLEHMYIRRILFMKRSIYSQIQ
jgi:hypothetical protein